jgi:hypothetical protein
LKLPFRCQVGKLEKLWRHRDENMMGDLILVFLHISIEIVYLIGISKESIIPIPFFQPTPWEFFPILIMIFFCS